MKNNFIFIYIFLLLSIFSNCNVLLAQTLQQDSENINRDSSSFVLKQVKVNGVTVLSDSEIQNIIVEYLNQNISFEELRNISQKLTDLYISKGYVTSGAFFPEQDLTQGIATVRVIEGSLEEINIEGLNHLSEKYLLSRLTSLTNQLVNINKLEDSIKLLIQNPLIERIDANLVEGSNVGKSKLLLNVLEAPVWSSNLLFNNYNSANNGELQGVVGISNQNLLGIGDHIETVYSLSDGFNSLNIGYEIPLSSLDNSLRFQYSNGDSKITASIFDDFGIRADAETFMLQFAQPIVKSIDREISIFLALERRTSNTFIDDDIPFSFTEGPEEGQSKATVLRLGSSWTERSIESVISANSRFNLGLDLFEITNNSEGLPDAIFLSWLGQFQFAHVLNKKRDALLITRLAAQLTPDSLLPFEQISLGGSNTVRGYRENREIGDNGVFGTIETHLPLIKDSDVGKLKLVPFFDAGRVWNTNGIGSITLASLGLGLDWEVKSWLRFNLDYGIPLINEGDFEDDSLQDNGIHFQLKVLPF